MSRFNGKAITVQPTAINYAGGQAFQQSSKMELVSLVLTSFVKDKFYRSAGDELERLRELLPSVEPLFLAKLAVYARRAFNMRSISHALTAEVMAKAKGENWTRNFLSSVVVRVDDVTEILSYYMTNIGRRPIPNALRRGLGDALGKFDAYQLAKYRSEGKALSLVDAINILHPRPTERNREGLTQLMNGTLKSTDTWESRLSSTGAAETEEEQAALKNAAWKDLLTEGKLGYLAALRNCRNILEQAPDCVGLLCEFLCKESVIHRARILPFQFQSAYAAVQELKGEIPTKQRRQVITALNAALEYSVRNVPDFSGDTVVVVDDSGSMKGQPIEIASLFAAVFVKRLHCDVVVFSDHAQYCSMNANDSLFTIQQQIVKGMRSRGTNFHAIFATLQRKYDRIIILSDMQGWMGYHSPTEAFREYKRKYQANPFVYSFDLTGYGSLQFPEDKVFAVAGFSEKTLELMGRLEQDREALLHEIEAVTFTPSTTSNSATTQVMERVTEVIVV